MNFAARLKETLTIATAQQSEACPLLTEGVFFYKGPCYRVFLPFTRFPVKFS